jgi:hypothetical protein
MKNQITHITVFAAICFFTIPGDAFAQDQKKAQAYRIKLIEVENGKEKMLDTSFASKELMQAFLEARNISML